MHKTNSDTDPLGLSYGQYIKRAGLMRREGLRFFKILFGASLLNNLGSYFWLGGMASMHWTDVLWSGDLVLFGLVVAYCAAGHVLRFFDARQTQRTPPTQTLR